MGVELGEWAWQPAINTGSRTGGMVYGHVKGIQRVPVPASRGGKGPGSQGISASQKRERIDGGQTVPGVRHLVAQAPSGTERLRPAGDWQVGGTDGKGTGTAPVKD